MQSVNQLINKLTNLQTVAWLPVSHCRSRGLLKRIVSLYTDHYFLRVWRVITI